MTHFQIFYDSAKLNVKMEINDTGGVVTHQLQCREDPFLVLEFELTPQNVKSFIKSNFSEEITDFQKAKQMVQETLLQSLSNVDSVQTVEQIKNGDICILHKKSDEQYQLEFITFRNATKLVIASLFFTKASPQQIATSIFAQYQLLNQTYQNESLQQNKQLQYYKNREEQLKADCDQLTEKLRLSQKQNSEHSCKLQQQTSLQTNYDKMHEQYADLQQQFRKEQEAHITKTRQNAEEKQQLQQQVSNMQVQIQNLQEQISFIQKQVENQKNINLNNNIEKSNLNNLNKNLANVQNVQNMNSIDITLKNNQIDVPNRINNGSDIYTAKQFTSCNVAQLQPNLTKSELCNKFASTQNTQQSQYNYTQTKLSDNPVFQRLKDLEAKSQNIGNLAILSKYSRYIK